MKIVVIADIHGRIGNLSIAEADIRASHMVLLTGDITNFGGRQEAERILEALEGLAQNILAVPGNCDFPDVETVLTERGYNLDGRGREVDGLGFVGLGGSLPAPGGTPNEYSEDELAQRLSKAANAIDLASPFLLVSHQPPINTSADRVRPGQHVGSQRIRKFIENHRPMACLTGHIHEGVGIDTIGKTKIVNPGPLPNGRYGYLEIVDGQTKAELRGASPKPYI